MTAEAPTPNPEPTRIYDQAATTPFDQNGTARTNGTGAANGHNGDPWAANRVRPQHAGETEWLTAPAGFKAVQYEPDADGVRTWGFEASEQGTELDLSKHITTQRRSDGTHAAEDSIPEDGFRRLVRIKTEDNKTYWLDGDVLRDVSSTEHSQQQYGDAAVHHAWTLKPAGPQPYSASLHPQLRAFEKPDDPTHGHGDHDAPIVNRVISAFPSGIREGRRLEKLGEPQEIPLPKDFPVMRIGEGIPLDDDSGLTTAKIKSFEIIAGATEYPLDTDDFEERATDPVEDFDTFMAIATDIDAPEESYTRRDFRPKGLLGRFIPEVPIEPEDLRAIQEGGPGVLGRMVERAANRLRRNQTEDEPATPEPAQTPPTPEPTPEPTPTDSNRRERRAALAQSVRARLQGRMEQVKMLHYKGVDYFYDEEKGARRRRAAIGAVAATAAVGAVVVARRRDGKNVLPKVSSEALNNLQQQAKDALPDKARLEEIQSRLNEKVSEALPERESIRQLRGRVAAKIPTREKARNTTRRFADRSFDLLVNKIEEKMTRRQSGAAEAGKEDENAEETK